MKNILVILGHPSSQSFCNAVAEHYAEGAKHSGTEVRVLKLGELNFNPILDANYQVEKETQALEPDLRCNSQNINDSISPEHLAEKRAKAKLGFIIHLVVFSIVSNVQYLQGLFSWDFSFFLPTLGWGLGVLIHGFAVFIGPSLRLQERLLEYELKQLKK